MAGGDVGSSGTVRNEGGDAMATDVADAADAAAALARELRLAKDRSGLTLTRLATRAWYSKSSLQRYLEGQVFPPRRAVAALADSCGADPAALLALWERAWAERERRDRPERPDRPAPAELPADLVDFTGRGPDIAGLLAVLAPDHDPSVPPVVAISGPPGIGKTSLAVHLGHRLRRHYPDGQLFGTLGGTDPESAGATLGRVLRALGVTGSAIPESAPERAAVYRSRLAGRRVLLVVDGVAAAEQVRDLVPGTGTSALIVTGRDRLVGLTGARLHQLSPLRRPESTDLLRRIAGPRVAASADRVLAHCGDLPLAVRLAGARIAAGDDTVEGLATARPAPGSPRPADPPAEHAVRAALPALDAAAGAALARLARSAPGPVQDWVVSAAAGLDLPAAARCLDALLAAGLLQRRGTDPAGRPVAVLHEVVRELVRSGPDDPVQARHATERLTAGWLALAEGAERALRQRYFPARRPFAPRWEPARDVPVGDPLTWYGEHRAALVAAVHAACSAGSVPAAASASELATLLTSFFALRNDWDAWRETHEAVLATSGGGDPYALRGIGELDLYVTRLSAAQENLVRARRLLDEQGGESSGYILALLASVRRQDGDLRAAGRYVRLATERFERDSDERGLAHARIATGIQRGHQLRWPEAVQHFQDALGRLDEVEDVGTIAYAHYWLGVAERMRGDLAAALRHLEVAEARMTGLGDELFVARCWRQRADVLVAAGRQEEAIALLVRTLAVMRDVGSRVGEATAMHGMGMAVGSTDPAQGRELLRRAIELADVAGSAFVATRIRAGLAQLDRSCRSA